MVTLLIIPYTMIPYHIYMSCYNYLNYNTYHVLVGSTVRIISTSTLVAIDDKYREDLDPSEIFPWVHVCLVILILFYVHYWWCTCTLLLLKDKIPLLSVYTMNWMSIIKSYTNALAAIYNLKYIIYNVTVLILIRSMLWWRLHAQLSINHQNDYYKKNISQKKEWCQFSMYHKLKKQIDMFCSVYDICFKCNDNYFNEDALYNTKWLW